MHSSAPPPPPHKKLDSALCLQLHAHTLRLHSSIEPPQGCCHPGSCKHLSWQLQGSWQPELGIFLFIALTLYLDVLPLPGCKTCRR